jgi:hypothetical protein
MLGDARLLLLPAVVVMLAAAGPSSMIQKAFGGTIVSTYPDHRQAKLWLDPSGSYQAMGRRGDRSRGTWRIKGDRLCLKQKHPAAPPFFRYCTAIPTQERWTSKAVTGEPIQVQLVRGRPNRPPGGAPASGPRPPQEPGRS